MPDLEEELKEQIIERIQLDGLIQKYLDKQYEENKSEIEDTGVYADQVSNLYNVQLQNVILINCIISNSNV